MFVELFFLSFVILVLIILNFDFSIISGFLIFINYKLCKKMREKN